MATVIGTTTADELRRLLGLVLSAEQRVQLLREIEERDPDRLRVRESHPERLLSAHRRSDETSSLRKRKSPRIISEFVADDSVRPVAERLRRLLLLVGHRRDRKRVSGAMR
jgi:hypothetical protein